MKRNKIYSFAYLALLFFSFFWFATTPKVAFAFEVDIKTSAQSMILIEQNTKRVLLEKNKNLTLPMASTTKIMTALSVLKRSENLETSFEIDKRAVGIEGTSMYLRKGENLSLKDLLYGMMISSGNDAACALALHFSATIEEFALIMNNDAKELGLKNSNFKNPHGLDEKGHYTTAFDLAIITAEAMKYDFFREMISQKTVSVKGAGGDQGETRLLVNKNKLLGHYSYCTGGKIGFTDNAGRCLVATATKDDLNLISVVFNCPDMFLDSMKILEYGINNYIYTELLQAYKVHRKIIVDGGKEEEVKIYTKHSFHYPLTLDETMSLSFDYDLPESLTAPIQKEQVIGTYKISLNGQVIFKEKLYTLDEVKSIKVLENIKDIASNWW